MTDKIELDYLVLDAGAIIRGHGLNLFKDSKEIVTVPEVLGEIRDSKSRDLLSRLPFELVEKTPSADAMRAVAEHAKKTGDFAALSKTDLKLIALTYMLETELCGITHLKKISEATSLKAKMDKTIAEKTTPAPTSALPSMHKLSLEEDIQNAPGREISLPDDDHKGGYGDNSGGEGDDKDNDKDGGDKLGFEEGDEESDSDEQESTWLSVRSVSGEQAAEMEKGISASSAFFAGQEQEQLPAPPTASTSAEIPPPTVPKGEVPEGTPEEAPVAVAKPAFSWAAVAAKQGPVVSFACESHTTIIPYDAKNDSNNNNSNSSSSSASLSSDLASSISEATAVDVTAGSSRNANRPFASNILSSSSGMQRSEKSNIQAAMDDDGVGWVNSSNIKSHLSSMGNTLGTSAVSGRKKNKNKKKNRVAKVACLTTDFSMQNVLMQIGLNIVSVDGMLIKSIKQWVLRCMACYQIHYNMDRLFCSKCGVDHLSRVAASIDTTGELKLHLKKNYHHDLRGMKYSLPAPGKQDRYSGELLMREDQMMAGIWRQKCVKIRKDVKSVFGEDVTGDVGIHINKGQQLRVGLGQRNPNATKGRERRGKKKK